MSIYVKIKKNQYIDSIDTLIATSIASDVKDIEKA
jgi:hypothetical protein